MPDKKKDRMFYSQQVKIFTSFMRLNGDLVNEGEVSIEDIVDAIQEAEELNDVFDNLNESRLSELTAIEETVDKMEKELKAKHFIRLADGDCSMEVSPYYSSTVSGLERVADHLVNVGYSIVSPVGSQKK